MRAQGSSPPRSAPRGAHDLLRLGASAVVVTSMVLVAGGGLWVGMPLAWLWIGSQIQGETGSLGAAVGAMLFGFVASVAAVVPVLAWLNGKYRRIRISRGLDDMGNFMLEVVLVTTAVIAVTVFVVWFLAFAGTSPIPINISY